MTQLDNLFDVVIRRETGTVQQATFDVPLVFGPSVAMLDRVTSFTSPDTISDYFPATDPNAIALNAIFAQDPSPALVKFGRQQVDLVVVTVDTVADNTDYTLTASGVGIDEKTITITSDGTATAEEIAAAIVAAVNADPDLSPLLTLTDNLDGTYDVANVTPGTPFTLSVDSRQSLGYTSATNRGLNQLVPASSESGVNIATGLAAIKDADNDWYALVTTSAVVAEVLLVAAWVESNKKVYIGISSDSNIPGTTASADTTTLAAQLVAAAYTRTIPMYSGDIDGFPDAAYWGMYLPYAPGEADGEYKTLAGITYDNLTDTQVTNLVAKGVTYYTRIAGNNVIIGGKTAAPEWIDVIRDGDWYAARIQERAFQARINSAKVPFTDAGIAVFENVLRTMTEEAITAGFLTADPAPVYTIPKAADVPQAMRTSRVLEAPYCLKARSRIAGSIRKACFQVTIYP